MPTLHLNGIVCEKTKEAVDEPYLVADSDNQALGTIWGPRSMDDGDARSIYWSRSFNQWIQLKLYEYDRVGHDEHIDTLLINSDAPEAGEQSYVFLGDRAKYRLIYELRSGARDNSTLSLISLRCNDAQEITDEPYITVNGVTQWGPRSMKTRDIQDINREVTFNRTAIIEIWERDPAISEKIGTSHVVDYRIADPGEETGVLTATFNGDRGIPGSASYTLTYRVRRRRP
jgi:hypothetical protein